MDCCSVHGEGLAEDSGDFFEIKPECRDEVPKTRFKPKAGKTLSARRWHSSFSEEGYLDIARVLKRIQRGGIHPSIKGVVWEFLLGCYDPKSTFDQRIQLRQRRREQYEIWKLECQEMEETVGSGKIITAPIITEDGQPIPDMFSNDVASQAPSEREEPQELEQQAESTPVHGKIMQWKLSLHQIGLDVVRTDRTLMYYENEKNLARLWDILAVYSWIDRDIGYCQGMSDLCSPMVIILENEVDAFWCFEHLMRRMRGNFRCTASSVGVQSQLGTLASIIKAVDPKLHQHLENLDGGEYLFAFRMLMVLFRREFSFVDSLYLWELMWAMEYNPHLFTSYESMSPSKKSKELKESDGMLNQYGKFERDNVKNGCKDQQGTLSIFLVASVLEAKNRRLLKEAKGLDDVVKILNSITGSLDAKKACTDALKIHKKYLHQVNKS
uniref:TBC1 domain family member 15 n=1 Tax=Anthurium amnicola TaxID=1678845 RepID=A0A1D1ZDG7_9ARAE